MIFIFFYKLMDFFCWKKIVSKQIGANFLQLCLLYGRSQIKNFLFIQNSCAFFDIYYFSFITPIDPYIIHWCHCELNVFGSFLSWRIYEYMKFENVVKKKKIIFIFPFPVVCKWHTILSITVYTCIEGGMWWDRISC